MAVRSIVAVVLGAVLVACGSPGPAGSGVAPPGSAAANGTGAGPSVGTGTAGLVDEATLASLAELAAAENQLVDDVALAANLPTDLGAGTWAWVNQLLHDTLADAGERLALTGPASQTAAFLARPPMVAVDGGGALGLGMAAGLILSGLGDPGSPSRDMNQSLNSTQERTENGERTVGTVTGHIAMTATGSSLEADVEIGVEVTVTDAATGAVLRTASFRSRGTIKLELCPDANGNVKGRVTISLSGGTNGGGNATMDIDAEVTGTVGDDANLQSIDMTGSNTQTSTPPGGRPGRRSVVAGGFTAGVGPRGTIQLDGSTEHGEVVEESEPVTQEEANAAFRQIGQAAGAAVWLLGTKAQDQWQGGACVEIRATEQSRDVAKNELVQFEARPFHKIEQRDLDKPIVPDFAGKATLDPVGIAVPSPVLLSFKAGPLVGDIGTITLTSTSNRGIGTLTIEFRVKGGWVIDEASGGGRVKGLKCGDPTGDWVVDGTYSQAGFDGTQKWTITIGADGRTGTFVYDTDAQGAFAGITVYQTGVAAGKVTLTIERDGTAHMDVVEETRSFSSTTSVGGHGSDVPLPPRSYKFDWVTGGSC